MRRLKDLGFGNPEIAAEQLLQILYSTVTQSEPSLSIDSLKTRFAQAGGSITEFNAGLNFALANDWIVLRGESTRAEFGKAGLDLYS